MARNYPKLFAILKKNDLTKEEVVFFYTDGKTDSLKALSDKEFNGLMAFLEKNNHIPAGDQIRKKMIAICMEMRWGDITTTVQRLDNWCLQQKYKKPLMMHNPGELALLVTILQTRVLVDYYKDLNK